MKQLDFRVHSVFEMRAMLWHTMRLMRRFTRIRATKQLFEGKGFNCSITFTSYHIIMLQLSIVSLQLLFAAA